MMNGAIGRRAAHTRLAYDDALYRLIVSKDIARGWTRSPCEYITMIERIDDRRTDDDELRHAKRYSK